MSKKKKKNFLSYAISLFESYRKVKREEKRMSDQSSGGAERNAAVGRLSRNSPRVAQLDVTSFYVSFLQDFITIMRLGYV